MMLGVKSEMLYAHRPLQKTLGGFMVYVVTQNGEGVSLLMLNQTLADFPTTAQIIKHLCCFFYHHYYDILW